MSAASPSTPTVEHHGEPYGDSHGAPDGARPVAIACSTAWRECPDCGLVQHMGALRPGEVAACTRCGHVLRRRRRRSLQVVAALSATALLLLLVAATFPLLTFRLTGQETQTSLLHLPVAFEDQDMPLLAVAVLATTLLAPLARVGLTLGVLLGLRTHLSRATLVYMARLRDRLAPWAMIEVFLLGMFVAYTRLAALAEVQVGLGLYALGALMLVTVAADVWLDEHTMWDAIGRREAARGLAPAPSRKPPFTLLHQPPIGCDECGLVHQGSEGLACARCSSPLRRRKPQMVARTWALLATAAVLYIPANVYPVMTVIRLARGHPSTILGGVQELIEYRMWPLAALVFVASVLVPVLKLCGLGLLLVLTQRRSPARLVDRTRLFRLVDFVGRWSMIDVFMLAVLTALVRMGVIGSVTPGWGAVAFGSVVVCTMLAALSFDPRVAWDVSEEEAPAPTPARVSVAAVPA